MKHQITDLASPASFGSKHQGPVNPCLNRYSTETYACVHEKSI